MRTAKRTISTLVLAAVLGLGARPGHALQLLPNFTFDTGLQDWGSCCGGTGTVGFDPDNDYYASALSGSARLVHTQFYDGISETALFLTTCLEGADIAAGKKLVYGMKVRFETGEATVGDASLSLDFRAQPGCGGATIDGSSREVLTSEVARGTWVSVKLPASTPVVVPDGTVSLKLFAVIRKQSNGTLTANFDDIYVATADTPLCDGLPATLLGDGTDEFITGTDDTDVIVARGGVDLVDGMGGNDRICGGPGNDVLYGGDGDDRIYGEGGADELYGGADDDLLYGAGNNDKLYGGDGDDKLRGGTGIDTCHGDAGTNVKKKCELPFVIPF